MLSPVRQEADYSPSCYMLLTSFVGHKATSNGRRVAEWRFTFIGTEGLKVNAAKSEVMAGSSGGKIVVNSGKWPCGVNRK